MKEKTAIKKKGVKGGGQTALHIIFILLTIAYLVPLLLVVSASFSSEQSLMASGFSLIPGDFTLDAYRAVFSNPAQILQSYKITILFSAAATLLTVLIMGVMAYPLSRPGFVLKNPITFFVFFTMLFSGGMVPSYLLITRYLHLDDTIWVYILPSLVSAYNLIIIRTNYKNIPGELIEAAKIDGARELYICFKIVMPLSKATLASIGFLFLVGKWNDWLTASLYIRNPDLYSLQYLLQRILREVEYLKQLAELNMLTGAEAVPTESVRYAMALVAAGPMLVVFPFFQKYFAKGMTIGAVKG